jgi:hypothetical protein
MKHTLATVVGAVLLLNCAEYAGAETHKPVQTLHILFVAPDSSDALSTEVDLIVHVRVLANRPQATADARFVHTIHDARVLDVLKSDVSADCAAQAQDVRDCSPIGGQQLRFLQKAGEAETPDAVIRIADQVPLKAGSESILFLKWDAHLKAFLPLHGPDGTFEVRDGVIRPSGHSPVAQGHSGKSAVKFKEEFRLRERERWSVSSSMTSAHPPP